MEVNTQASELVDTVGAGILNSLGTDVFRQEGEVADAIRGKTANILARVDLIASVMNDVGQRADLALKVKEENVINQNDWLKADNVKKLEALPVKDQDSKKISAMGSKVDATIITDIAREKGEITKVSSTGKGVSSVDSGEVDGIVEGIASSERSTHNSSTEAICEGIRGYRNDLSKVDNISAMLKGERGGDYRMDGGLSVFSKPGVSGRLKPEDFAGSAYSHLHGKNNELMSDRTREINDESIAKDADRKAEEKAANDKAQKEKAEKLEEKGTKTSSAPSGGGGGGSAGGGGGAPRMMGGSPSFGGGGGSPSFGGGGRSGGGSGTPFDIKNLTEGLDDEEIDIDKMLSDMLEENQAEDSEGDSVSADDIDDSTASSKGVKEAVSELEDGSYNVLYDTKGSAIGYSTSDETYIFDPETGDPVELSSMETTESENGTIFEDPNTGQQYRINIPDEFVPHASSAEDGAATVEVGDEIDSEAAEKASSESDARAEAASSSSSDSGESSDSSELRGSASDTSQAEKDFLAASGEEDVDSAISSLVEE